MLKGKKKLFSPHISLEDVADSACIRRQFQYVLHLTAERNAVYLQGGVALKNQLSTDREYLQVFS